MNFIFFEFRMLGKSSLQFSVYLSCLWFLCLVLVKTASSAPVMEEGDKRAGHNIMRFGRQAGHTILRFGRAPGHNIMRFGKRDDPANSYETGLTDYEANSQASPPYSSYYGSPVDDPAARMAFLYPAHLLPYQSKKAPMDNVIMRFG